MMNCSHWTVPVSEDGDYVNITQLAEQYDLKIEAWAQSPNIKTLIKYLDGRGLEPFYEDGKNRLLRVELLPTLMAPPFISTFTPPVRGDLVKELIDVMLSNARSHQGKETFYIYPGESEKIAHSKAQIIQRLYRVSVERYNIAKNAEGEMARAYRRVASREETEQIRRDLAKEVPESTQYPNLHDLVTAMKFESAILSTKHRMTLAMLMLNDMSRRSLDRSEHIQLRQSASLLGISI